MQPHEPVDDRKRGRVGSPGHGRVEARQLVGRSEVEDAVAQTFVDRQVLDELSEREREWAGTAVVTESRQGLGVDAQGVNDQVCNLTVGREDVERAAAGAAPVSGSSTTRARLPAWSSSP